MHIVSASLRQREAVDVNGAVSVLNQRGYRTEYVVALLVTTEGQLG